MYGNIKNKMLLKKGMRNDLIKQVQEKLGTSVDGIFGSGTEKLVKEWQAANDLTADGLIGKGTWKKMFGTDIPSSTEPEIVIPPSEFKLNALKGHIPNVVIAQIPDTAEKFNITNPLRLAHFLAQCAHESGNFRAISENLNYSSKGLKSVFGRYFPGDLAESYARNPKKIASRVYGNRMGNGDEASCEGYKFRGRGYIQLTGKNNYTRFGKFINEDTINNPDLVSEKYPLASAAFFFDSNNLWKYCDAGADEAAVKNVTRRVNGGYNGLEDRLKHFKEYYNLLK